MLAVVLVCAWLTLAARVLWWMLERISWDRTENRRRWAGTRLPLRSLVVLGSGGHTMEMLSLLKDLDQDKYRCDFILGDTDSTSLKKVQATRPDLAENLERFHSIPRSREVGQSWTSTLFSTMKALASCLGLIWKLRPQVLIVNGPGTCIPVVAAALFFELVAFRSLSLVFVESVCRVKSLSMTGKLTYLVSDSFVVHWPELAERYPKAQYLGVLL
ncbi:ALG14 [Symbiodinium necroappetens]|uniref:UDP-N-acetylglucosamine transferase subunit ALG14 n=1 Tax=Symbiodinium necroappetens TaxID=1628268 RepID=A0A813AKL6_9DINO|nr:ALG14 [Symbiodinium necroappetens]